jgi:ABC-type uncharacterized transport system auxiliary subunit
MKTYLPGILLLAALVLSGCFSSTPATRYYLLDYIPTPTRTKNAPAIRPVTIRIKDFKVAEAYKRPELVYRKSSHEMQFYNYHQWAVKPEYLITDMVFKHLRAANLFKSISKSLLEYKPDYILTGQVTAIEEYDNKNKWYAHLAITLQLEDNKTRRQIWQRTYDVRKIVAQHEPVYVVRELSFLLENIMDKIVLELESILPKYTIPKSSDEKTEELPELKSENKPDSLSVKKEKKEKK